MLTSRAMQSPFIAVKKLLPLLIAALCAFAPVSAHAKIDRAQLVERVESCEAILQTFQRDPRTAIPASVLAKAKGLIIVNQFKAGLIFGVKAGYGAWMVCATTAWFCLVSAVFTRPAVRTAFLRHGHWVDRLLGAVFVVFAVSLALASVR